MAGIFWNARGLGEPEKRRFLKETICEHKVEFVCIQETKKKDFTGLWLAGISGNFTFIWLWQRAVGASGGLLMGVREDLFDVDTCVASKYMTRMTMMDKRTSFKWNLVNVYEAAHSRDKEEFLISFVQMLGSSVFPFVVGGDFNIIRRSKDRNKTKKLPKWSFFFNSIIEHWGLKELELSGRNFTWSNNQIDPLFVKLDRILVSPSWELKFPLVTVRTLVRGVSDHTASLMHTGVKPNVFNKPFRFELCWFAREDLVNIVNRVWSTNLCGKDNLAVW